MNILDFLNSLLSTGEVAPKPITPTPIYASPDNSQTPKKPGVFNDIGSNVFFSKCSADEGPENFKEKAAIRKWWHKILRNFKRYSCYCIFLILPSDKEAIRYFTKYGKEVKSISGDDCLIVLLTNGKFRISNVVDELQHEIWNELVSDYVMSDYSVKIAQYFNIDYGKLPAILLFKDFRSQDFVLFSLKNMNAEKISENMRLIFSIVHKAVSTKKDPVESLLHYQALENVQKSGGAVVNSVSNIVGKTFEKAIELWLEKIIT